MGNYVSCALTSAPGQGSSRAVQVLHPAGGIRHVSGGASAAELMLDFPGHFLVNSRSLRIGSRFSALSADEDLEPGNVYAMFPMRRVNSLVNAADMGPLVLAAGKAVRRASGGRARVLPEIIREDLRVRQEDVIVEAQAVAVEEEDEDETVTELRNRLSLCRSRRPRLETITEEPCACA